MDFDAARINMVDGQLLTAGVHAPALLAVFGAVPRERFLPPARRTLAYLDMDVPLDVPGRYLIEPTPLARLIAAAAIGPGEVVLDVGAATGYAAALMARLAGSVVALEADAGLADGADATLSALDVSNAAVVRGPLAEGWPNEGPYDAIVVSGGSVDRVPERLLDQLKEGGRLVAVVGRGRAAQAIVHTRLAGRIGTRAAFDAALPNLPGFETQTAFVFPS